MDGNGGELSSFLTKLSEDRELQEAYVKDPEGTLRQAGVSEETIGTVMSRDLGKIKAAVERELEAGLHIICFMVITEPTL